LCETILELARRADPALAWIRTLEVSCLVPAQVVDGVRVFGVGLGHLAGEDLRPHLPDRHGDFTAEPSPEIALAPSTPLADLLEPLTLDPLTAHDDSRLVTLLAKERNLPKEIAAAIPDLY
jgi:hypothetical protein